MTISQNALTVLQKRYLIKNEKGETTETVEGLFRRVAAAIAAPDRLHDEKADVKKTEETFFLCLLYTSPSPRDRG